MQRRAFIGTCAAGALISSHKNAKALSGSDMDILFTGTGAADWPQKYPSPSDSFTPGEYRGNASMVVDGFVLVDCGSTVPDALGYHGVATESLTDIFITHSHGDHLRSESLDTLAEQCRDSQKIAIRGHAGALARADIPRRMIEKPLMLMESVETCGIRVTALPANHVVTDSNEQPLHFLFEKNGTRLLYATDGAWLLKPLWLYLREHPLDAIIFDATIGDVDGDWRIFEHNSLEMIRLMCTTLHAQKVLKTGADIVLTHMARTLWSKNQSMADKLESEGIAMACDGMRVTVKQS